MKNNNHYTVRVYYGEECKQKTKYSFLPLCDREGNPLIFDNYNSALKAVEHFEDYIIDTIIDKGLY